MESNLLTQFRNYISPGLISSFSKKYEESDILLKKSFDAALSTILIGLYNRIDEVNLLQNVLKSIENSEFYNDIKFEKEVPLLINNSFLIEGHQPLSILFLNKKARLSEMISNEVGIKSETAFAVFNLSVMFILSYFRNKNIKSVDLQKNLEDQKNEILKKIPQGIRVILGYSQFESIEESTKISFGTSLNQFLFSLKGNFI